LFTLIVSNKYLKPPPILFCKKPKLRTAFTAAKMIEF